MKEKLLSNFLRISSIPRESGHEDKIANFFVEVAKKNNLFYFKDEYNNVLIKDKNYQFFYLKDELYEIGITEMKTPYGNKVKVYDLERTICDIIKNRKRLDQWKMIP